MENLAMMPRYGGKNGTVEDWPEPSNAYYRSVTYWANAAYEEARLENQQNDEVREMSKYIDYLTGKQWPASRPSYRSKPIDNRIWKLFWELVSVLTDVKPTFEIKAVDHNLDPQAIKLNKVARAWWMNSDADLNLAMIVVYAILCTGYCKFEWNPTLRNGYGDFDLIPLGPNDVLPLKARHNLESAQALIYQSVMPLGFFRRKYPLRGSLVRPDPSFSKYTVPPKPPTHMPQVMFDLLSPQFKRVLGSKEQLMPSGYPMALYREFWLQDYSYNESNVNVTMGDPRSAWSYVVPPGQPLYPRGRLIVMGGDMVLDDGPNPYLHGKYPFACLRLNVVPWQFHGLSEMRYLLPLQDIVNNVLAGILDMVKRAVNPGFIAPKNAFSESLWNTIDWSMPGAKAAYSPIAPTAPTWAPQPQLPAFVLNVLQLVAREMDSTSGIASASEAIRKKQVPAADTLEQIKQTQQTPVRLKGRNIEVFLRHIGDMAISNMFQFYTKRQRFFVPATMGYRYEDIDWDPTDMIPAGSQPEDHIRKFSFMIHPGTLLKLNQTERAVLIMNMRKMRDLDRETMYQELDLGLDPKLIEAKLDEEQAKQLAMALKAKMAAGVVGGAPGGGGVQ